MENQLHSEQLAQDQRWIERNVQRFAILAVEGYTAQGRGAVFVNLDELILRRHNEEGHPFNYHTLDAWCAVEGCSAEDSRLPLQEFVACYDPDHEYLLALVREDGSTIYVLPLPQMPELESNLNDAQHAQEPQARMLSTDFWARAFSLASVHDSEWFVV